MYAAIILYAAIVLLATRLFNKAKRRHFTPRYQRPFFGNGEYERIH